MKWSNPFVDTESRIRLGIILFLVILVTLWIKRRDIAEMKVTKKKIEMIKAFYNRDIDSAQQIMNEMVDSSFYLK